MSDSENVRDGNNASEGAPQKGTEAGPSRNGWVRRSVDKARANWKPITAAGVGVAAVAGVSALVTLALTRNSAIAQNAAAYSNGLLDGFKSGRETYFTGFADGFDEGLDFTDWYDD